MFDLSISKEEKDKYKPQFRIPSGYAPTLSAGPRIDSLPRLNISPSLSKPSFNVTQQPEKPSLLSRLGKGFWEGGIRTAAEGYKQDGEAILYALQKETEAREKRLGITPDDSGKSYVNPFASSADIKREYEKLQSQVPYEPTDTAGKVGSMAGFLVGSAPAFALSGVATEGLANKAIAKLTPKIAPKILPYAERAVKDSLSFAPIGIMESDKLSEIPKNVGVNMATGAVLGPAFVGAGKLIGKGISEAKGMLKPLGVPDAPYGPPRPTYNVQRRSGLGPLKSNDPVTLEQRGELLSAIKKADALVNPLEDVQNAYKSPSLKDVLPVSERNVKREIGLGDLKLKQTVTPKMKARRAEISDTFLSKPLVDVPLEVKTLQEGIDSSLGIGKQNLTNYNAPEIFGGPLKSFRKSTDMQDTIAEITTKMTKYANDVTKTLKQMDKDAPIETTRLKIQKMGGIKPSKGDLFEEQQIIPSWIKNKNGRPLDEVSDTLGMSSDELRSIINSEAFKPKNYADEAFKVLRNDPEYQALESTLQTLKGQLPGKRTLDVMPKLKPRELTPKPEPLPIEQPQRLGLSGTLPVDVPIQPPIRPNIPLKQRTLRSPQPMEQIPIQRILPEQPERLTWTNRDIPSAGPEPIRSITPANMGRDMTQLPTVARQEQANIGSIRPVSQQVDSIGQQTPLDLPTPQSKIIIGKQKEKMSFRNSLNKFYDRIVNNQQAIVDGAKITNSDMGRLASNTKNVSGIVDYNFLKGMVNKKGEKVSESLKTTVDKIPKGREEDFWTYMSQRHNIDRAREGKNVQANYTPEMSAEAVRIAEEANPAYKAAGDGIVKWLDDFMRIWGVDTGIVNKEVYANLRQTYKSYFPTQRDFSELEKAIPDNVSQKFADQRTPIRKATTSKRDIIDPVENIMKLVDRTIRTAKYNEVGQSLLNSVREAPEKLKPLAEVIKTQDGMFANTDNVITVLEDGKPVYLKINDKRFLDAMNGLPKSIGEIPVLSTLTNGFKQLITQSNPIFAVRNIFRDIPTAYVYGSEANPIKFGAGLIGAAKDITTNSPRLQKYQAVGGGGANFFSAGDITKSAAELTGKINPIKRIVSAPIKAIQKFNNMTETAPRLAEFNRVLAKSGDVDKALFAANDVTVNFSRAGNITKNVDRVAPYLNAGVQGLDKFFRGIKDPKTAIQTIVKSGVAITTPTLALYLVNKDNPNYAAMDNRTKDAYYLIPKEDGTFIKLPKSRELGVLFSSLLERGLRANAGQDNSFKGFGNTVATNFSPANPIDSNFFTPALEIIGKGDNKDFANRPIVPQAMLMDKRSDYLQYDEKTTSIAKAIGEMTKGMPGNEDGVSPKQLDYFVKSYSGVIGQFGIPLATPGGSPKKALTSQFTADPTFSNQTTTDFHDKLDKLSAKAIDKNINEKIPSKKLTPEEDMKNSMNGVSSALNKGTKQINTLLASDDPQKEEKIKVIKTQMLELSRKSVLADTPKLMQRVEDEAKKIFK